MEKLNLKNFNSTSPNIKYAEAKKAIRLSEESPDKIYTYFDFFAELLSSGNNIFKWTGIKVLGNLSSVDKDGKIDAIMPELIKLTCNPRMITAANAIGALGVIAKNKPQFEEKIINAFLAVEHNDYYMRGELSPECGNIAIGHVLRVLPNFEDKTLNSREVREFIKRQIKNSRPAVAKLAEELIG